MLPFLLPLWNCAHRSNSKANFYLNFSRPEFSFNESVKRFLFEFTRNNIILYYIILYYTSPKIKIIYLFHNKRNIPLFHRLTLNIKFLYFMNSATKITTKHQNQSIYSIFVLHISYSMSHIYFWLLFLFILYLKR